MITASSSAVHLLCFLAGGAAVSDVGNDRLSGASEDGDGGGLWWGSFSDLGGIGQRRRNGSQAEGMKVVAARWLCPQAAGPKVWSLVETLDVDR